MVLSKGDVAFRLAASFDAAANATVDGSPAMGYTQLQSYLEHLPLELPRGAQFRGNITQLFRECAIRRGEKNEGPRHIMKKGSSGSGRKLSEAYTLPEVVSVLWDIIAWRIDKLITSFVEQPASKMRRVEVDKTIAAAFHSGPEIHQTNDLRGRHYDHDGDWVGWPTDNREFAAAATIICTASPELGDGFLAPMSIDECADEIALLAAMAFHVQVDTRMIREHIAPICLHRIEPTRFVAHTLARCQIMIEFLGVTLTTAMRRFMHIHNFGLPSIDVASDASSSLLSELVRTRGAMTQMKDLAQRGMTSLITDSMGASFVASGGGTILQTSKRQVKSDRVGHIVHAMATYATKLNIAFKHTPNSLAQAAGVLHVARRGTDASPDEADRALRDLVGDSSMRTHLPHIDSAIDLYTADRIAKAQTSIRKNNEF
jgi:hypothetical protein